MPFIGRGANELKNKILRGQMQPLVCKYSQELQGVVRSLLVTDPAARLTMKKLVRMPTIAAHAAKLRPSSSPSSVIDTIKVPRNITDLSKKLPGAARGKGLAHPADLIVPS